MIFTINTRDYILYPVIKSHFKLNDNDIYNEIQMDFKKMLKRLEKKNISYDSLKGALIPNQDKTKYEICLIFDTTTINESFYGNYIFEKILPLLEKDSTYSILSGDYIDFSRRYDSDTQAFLLKILEENLTKFNKFDYSISNQFYLIYINRLTTQQRLKIVEGLAMYSWFTGYVDVTYCSIFKTYISNILPSLCIKNKNKIIAPHPVDYSDEENVNVLLIPFEENGFKLHSINEESYSTFLSYKIESEVLHEEDVKFAFNALFPKFNAFDKLKLRILDGKWNNYLTLQGKGKGKIIELLGYNSNEKELFTKCVFEHICKSYIYNLERNDYGDLLFNVCIELPTVNAHIRKTTIALKYIQSEDIIEIVTIT